MKIKLINTLYKITTIIFNVLEIVVFISVVLLFFLRMGLFQDYVGKKIISSLGTEWSEQISISQFSIHDLMQSGIILFSAQSPPPITLPALAEAILTLDM